MDKRLFAPYSKSKIQLFQKCPYWYKQQYTKQVDRQFSEIGTFGIAIHDSLDYWLKNDMLKEDLEPLDKLGANSNEKFQNDEALKIYQQAKQLFTESIFTPDVTSIDTEIKVAIDKDNNIVDFFDDNALFRGVVDVVAHYKNHSYSVYDWKTGFKKEDFLQLNIYAYILNQMNPFEPIKEVGYIYPRSNSISAGEATFENMDYALNYVKRVAMKIEAEKEFKPKRGSHCDYCPVYLECPLFKEVDENKKLSPQRKMELSEFYSKMSSRLKKEAREYCVQNETYIEMDDGVRYGLNPDTNRFGKLKKG